MDASVIDTVSRLFAVRSNRRTALRAGAGLAGAAAGISVLQHVSAQDATPVASPGASTIATAPKDLNDPIFMFVQSFESGTITPSASADNAFTLSLKHGGGQTVYFSDRPERIFGATPTDRFFTGMSFAADNPPNAALVMNASADDQDVVVVELTNPAYDGGTGTLSYTATLLEDYEDLGVTLQAAPKTAAELHESFGGASLFIDDCSDQKIACVRVTNGEEDCMGNIKVGFCWSWADGCVVCHDNTALCNSTFASWCDGDCDAISNEVCPSDCTYC